MAFLGPKIQIYLLNSGGAEEFSVEFRYVTLRRSGLVR